MDLTYDLEAQKFREMIRQVLADELPADWQGIGALDEEARQEFLASWRTVLLERRLFVPGWPVEYGGGGHSVLEQSIVMEEFTRAGVPGETHPNDMFGKGLLGPTLLHWGTEKQKEVFIAPTIRGDIKWAQGYSEPEAGSDLFNLRTRAVLDGDEWVVNGSKIWQTAGVTANWIFALVRTDLEAVRSKGISFMMIPLDQPGVEVRGIKNMVGETEFAEVFFTEARTAKDNIIGGINNGAKVALTLLGFERGSGGISTALEAQNELARLVELAKEKGVAGDPLIRQRIAKCYTTTHIAYTLALKTLTTGAAGGPPGPESSITKLMWSEHRKTVTELAADILGLDALTPQGMAAINPLGAQPHGFDALSSRGWVEDFLHARPGTVYGGSSEIQRNTIAEQVLGLPREPRTAIPLKKR